MNLTQATATCPRCERKFHQIDGTEERALKVVLAALNRHTAAVHPEVVAPDEESA